MFLIFTNKLAQAVSFLVHPLIIPTIIYILLAIFRPDLVLPFTADNITFLIVTVAFFSFVIPAILIVSLFYFKKISTLLLDNQDDRQKALVATSIVYMLAIYVLHVVLRLNNVGVSIFGYITFCIILAMIITKYWKISLHCIGAAGLVIFCAYIAYDSYQYLSFVIFLFSVILSGFLASARLHLNKHSLAQVAAGYFLGLVVGFVFLSYQQLYLAR